MANFVDVHRQRVTTPGAPRWPLRWLPNRLWPGRGRAPGTRPGSAAAGERLVLRDGSAVLIRQVRPSDAPLVAAGFARLSARSRRMRFLYGKDKLSAAELRYLTNVDHFDHEALGALDHPGGRGVGVARYVRDTADPRSAEIAVTIVDDGQGLGLATELLARLSERARAAGIRRFTALVAEDNAAMAGVLRKLCADRVGRGGGTVDNEITLA